MYDLQLFTPSSIEDVPILFHGPVLFHGPLGRRRLTSPHCVWGSGPAERETA